MPGKRKETMDIREMLRRLRQGESNRAMAEAMHIDRKTVGRYRTWAAEQGLLEGRLPSLGDLHRLLEETLSSPPPPQNTSSVEPYREVVIKLRDEGVEIAAIYERLKERGYQGSYSSVYRFVRNLEPRMPDVTVRVETEPGEEGQVDFGYAGRMIDPETGELRRTWAFVFTLSWSRHQYVEFVFDQKVETWLRLHRNAFAFFGGVPKRVVIDNLKAGIARVCWHEPQAQQSYRECAEHYDFLIDPCRPRKPEHKGKVEQGGVHYPQGYQFASNATSWAVGSQPPSLRPTGMCCAGCTPLPGSACTAPSRKSPWRASRSNVRRCSRCRSRPTTWRYGSRLSCIGIAIWSSITPTTRLPSAWWGSNCGCAAAPGKSTSTPITTSWSPPIRVPGVQANGSRIWITCRLTKWLA